MWWPFNRRYPERLPSKIDGHTYDYVVVGGMYTNNIYINCMNQDAYGCLYCHLIGGTAGCVLASRLSEDPETTVLLLERGIANDTWMSRIPLVSASMLTTKMGATSWDSEPLRDCDGRRDPLFVGEALGGSSRINGMIYTRGSAADYDAWGSLGHPEWAFDKLLPYFLRGETTLSRPNTPYRGHSGTFLVHHSIMFEVTSIQGPGSIKFSLGIAGLSKSTTCACISRSFFLGQSVADTALLGLSNAH